MPDAGKQGMDKARVMDAGVDKARVLDAGKEEAESPKALGNQKPAMEGPPVAASEVQPQLAAVEPASVQSAASTNDGHAALLAQASVPGDGIAGRIASEGQLVRLQPQPRGGVQVPQKAEAPVRCPSLGVFVLFAHSLVPDPV